jgi:predicted Zn-dependent protease
MLTGIDRKQELFRVLNGLEAGDTVEVGRLVKLVAD